MKHLPVAGKAITLLFTAAFLVACSGSDTKRRRGSCALPLPPLRQLGRCSQAAQEAAAEQQRLEDAAAAVGNVFYFDFDSSTLTPDAIDALNAHIAPCRATTAVCAWKATPMSAAPASTTWPWVSAVPIPCATTWSPTVSPVPHRDRELR